MVRSVDKNNTSQKFIDKLLNDHQFVKAMEQYDKTKNDKTDDKDTPESKQGTTQSGEKPSEENIKAFLDRDAIEFKRKGANVTRKEVDAVIKLIFVDKFLFGRDRLFQYLKDNDDFKNLNVTRRKVMRILQALTLSQLFAPKRTKIKDVRKFIASKPFARIQFDLIDVTNIEYNDIKFLWTAIDTFSKFAIAIPMTSKDNKHSLKTAKEMIKQIKDVNDGNPPESVLSDNGSEFINDPVQKYFKSINVPHILSKSGTPSSHGNIESFNRILRQLIAKYKLQFDDPNWLKILPTLIKNYNLTINRNTNAPPIDIIKNNEQKADDMKNNKTVVTNEEVRNHIIKRTMPKNNNELNDELAIGDVVRLKQEVGSAFEKKSMNINFSRELYKIIKVFKPKALTVLAPTYKIQNTATKKDINERFYGYDLMKVDQIQLVNIRTSDTDIVSHIYRPFLRKDNNGNYQQYYEIKFVSDRDRYYILRSVLEADIPKQIKNFEKNNEVLWDDNKVSYIDPKTKKKKAQSV